MNSPTIPDSPFITRHIGPKENEIYSMMNELGFTSLNYFTNTIVPENILGAAHRLMLHGLAAECLHGFLVQQKRQQQKTQDTDE